MLAAVRNKHYEKIDYLLEHELDPLYVAPSGDSALSVAFANLDFAILRAFQDYVLDIFKDISFDEWRISATEAAELALIQLCHGTYPMLPSQDSEDLLTFMRELEFNLNFTDDEGRTLMHHAVLGRNLDLVFELFEYGLDINSRDFNQITPVMLASYANDGIFQLVFGKLAIEFTSEDFASLKGKIPKKCENELNKMFKEKRDIAKKAVLSGDINTIMDLKGSGFEIDSNLEYDLLVSAMPSLKSFSVLTRICNTDFSGTVKLLHHAVSKGEEYLEIIEFLIQSGCPVNDEYKKKTALLIAVQKQSVALVQNLLSHGASPEVETQNLLHLSVKNKNIEIFKLIFCNTSMPYVKDSHQNTLIHMAAKFDFIELLQYLMNDDQLWLCINDMNKNGDSALHIAAANNRIGIVEILIEKGARLNVLDAKGRQPLDLCGKETEVYNLFSDLAREESENLFTAISNGDLQYLIEKVNVGIDFNTFSNEGRSTLHVAVISKKLEVVEFLINNNTNINAQDSFMKTPLHIAVEKQYDDIAALLLSYDNIDVNIPDLKGCLPFHYIRDLRVSCIASAVIRGVNLDAQDLNGNSILHSAVMNANFDDVEAILTYDPNLELTNIDGNTALNIAVIRENIDIVEALVKKGANVFSKGSSGQTNLEISVNKPICKILRNRMNYLANILFLSISKNDINRLDSILKTGIDINLSEAKKGRTILHLACSIGALETVKFLIEREANLLQPDNYGDTPLHLAVKNNRVEVVSYFAGLSTNIHDGKMLNARNAVGESPLFIAARNGSTNILKILLDSNADPNAENSEGVTPIIISAKFNQKEAVSILLRYVPLSEPLILASADNIEIFEILNFQANIRLEHLFFNESMKDLVSFIEEFANTKLNFESSMIQISSRKNLTRNQGNKLAYLFEEIDLAVETLAHFVVGALDRQDLNVLEYFHSRNVVFFPESLKSADWSIIQNYLECVWAGLFHSVEVGNFEAVKYLLDFGIDINSVDVYKQSALHLAILYDEMEIFRLLLDMGINVNLRDLKNYTAIHLSAISGKLEYTRLLLDHMADADLRGGSSNNTALEFALINGHPNSINILSKNLSNVELYDIATSLPSIHWKSLKMCSASDVADAQAVQVDDAIIVPGNDQFCPLLNYLRRNNLIETESEVENRKRVYENFTDLMFMTNPNIILQIVQFGSVPMGTHGPNSDIDLLCVFKETVHPELLASRIYHKLSLEKSFQNLSRVPDHRFQLIKFTFENIDFDLVFVKESDYNSDYVAAGNGPKVTETILEIVGDNLVAFQTASRFIKHWADMRGIYGSQSGYIGGVGYAILVARICQMYPTASASELVFRFFETYSQWNWSESVTLVESIPPSFMRPMRVMTPANVSECATYNVGRSSLNLIKSELSRAANIWNDFESIDLDDLTTPTDLLTEHNHRIVITVSSLGAYENFRIVSSQVKAKLRHLSERLYLNAETNYFVVTKYETNIQFTLAGMSYTARYFISIDCDEISDTSRIFHEFVWWKENFIGQICAPVEIDMILSSSNE